MHIVGSIHLGLLYRFLCTGTRGQNLRSRPEYLTETWKSALDNGNVVGVVYIDFQKAFDTVSHEILIYKLQAMGLSGDMLKWFISYLKDRRQFAVVNGCSSQTKPVTCGVPQGSLLGPRLFTYYINDLTDSITEGKLNMYADDTTLHFIGNNVDEVVHGLNQALSKILLWCRNNKLTIHAGKSEAMIISHRAFCGPLKPITLGDKILNIVSETRCLGVIIDSQLSWNSHSDHLCKSFGKKVGQLKRFKYLSTRTLETIYFSSIVPTITYCSLVWGTSSPSLMYELEHIHARAAKTIHRLPRDISDQDALETTGWEPLTNQYRKKLLTLMYKVNSNITPDKITNLFSLANPYYNLRNSNHFVLPRFNLAIGRNSLRYRGPLVWGLTPTTLKQSPSLKNFKNLLKQNRHRHFINNISFLKEACMASLKNQDYTFLI